MECEGNRERDFEVLELRKLMSVEDKARNPPAYELAELRERLRALVRQMKQNDSYDRDGGVSYLRMLAELEAALGSAGTREGESNGN